MASTDVENVQALLAELERVKARLALYESSKTQTPTDDKDAKQKKRALKVFKAFDTDNSGDIDADEFQELSFTLGETLTKDEVNKVIKQLDKDNSNTVNFEEFYSWWSSDDRQKLRDSRTEEQHKQLALLKAKLTSKAYMKTALELLDAVKQAAASNAAPEKNKVSGSWNLTVGRFDEPDATFKLALRKDPETAKSELAKAKLSDTDILVSASFLAKEGVEQFDLGEFVGRITFALGAASSALKKDNKAFKLPKATWFKEGEQLGFTVSVAVGTDLHKALPKLFEFQDLLELETAAVDLSINKRPSPDVKLDDEGIAIKLTAKAAANRPALLKLAKKASKGDAPLDALLGLLTADVEVELDDSDYIVSSFPKDFHKMLILYAKQLKGDTKKNDSDDEDDKKLPKLTWAIPRAIATAVWYDLLSKRRSRKDETTQLAYEIYSKAVSTLESLHSVKVVAGSSVLEGKFQNFDVFSVLPTDAEIQAKIKKEEDDDSY